MASWGELLLSSTASLYSRHAKSHLLASSALLLVLVLSTLASLLLGTLFILRRRRSRSSGGSHDLDHLAFPKGPAPWPILGNLPLLHGRSLHRALADLSRKHGYGGTIGLRLGRRPAVIVSDPSVARELLLTHDKVFANRPHLAFADAIFYGYNSSVIFSSYSAPWLRLRKVCTLELFTAKRLQELQFIRQEEVRGLLRHLLHASADGGTRAVDVGRMLADMTSNTTTRLIYSKKASNSVLPQITRDLEEQSAPVLGDFIPWLAFLDRPKIRSMKKLHQRIDAFIGSMLAERREAMRTMPAHELPHDFLQVLLSKEVGDKDEHINTREIKAIALDILAAGVHTSATTTEWAMAELLRNPSCLRRLREEVDGVMEAEGRQGQQVTDEDVRKLPYLQSVVKEVLRLHAPLPMLVPRVSTEDCRLGGYFLPKGTLAFVNIFAIGRDERLWERAESFWPDRYMQDRKEAESSSAIAVGNQGTKEDGQKIFVDVDVNGQHYELLPFGSGRRMCPGIRLGLSVVHATLANLAQFFDWELPEGLSPASIDMAEKGALAMSKATPLLAIPKPRGDMLKHCIEAEMATGALEHSAIITNHWNRCT